MERGVGVGEERCGEVLGRVYGVSVEKSVGVW